MNSVPQTFELALQQHRAGNLHQAELLYRQILQLDPRHADALHLFGVIAHQSGRNDLAVDCIQEALRLHPRFPEAYNHLGIVLMAQGKVSEALASYRQALDLKPDYLEALNNLGNALQDQGKLDEAITYYQQALRLKPDDAEAHYNLGINRLFLGDFQRGWPEYEWRLQCQGHLKPRFTNPAWDGSPLKGRTILLLAEQGLGDTLQFIRYAPLVKQRGGRVLLACRPPLIPLLQRGTNIEGFVTSNGPIPPFDVYAPLMSLPLLLNHFLAEQFPADVPYLECAPDSVQRWRARLESVPGLRVGIAWQGNPGYHADRRRSIPLRHFTPLAEVPGVSLISLQKGPGSEQLAKLPGLAIDLGADLDTTAGPFMDSAAIMKNLDLVIAPDTAVAHLAGALDVPVWIPLPRVPHWIWQMNREDSPWYPSARLFRQNEFGNWEGVFKRMAANLQQKIGIIPGK
jgi:hypothetical protein